MSIDTESRRAAASLLAYLWCNRRLPDAKLVDDLARSVWGSEWWTPFFGEELEPGVRRFLYGAPKAHPETTEPAEDSPPA